MLNLPADRLTYPQRHDAVTGNSFLGSDIPSTPTTSMLRFLRYDGEPVLACGI